MMEQIRLNKYLAECGVCSRRDADRLIEEGRVQINGIRACKGQLVCHGDEVRVNQKIVQKQNQKTVLAFYKPTGVTCTERDVHAEKKITDVISYPVRVTYAGRLDKDSEGLLLLTNDGDLIDAIMRGANQHEKEYVVKVNKEVTSEFLSKMSGGIYLEELGITTRKCKAEQSGKYTFHLTLTQGVNRQIRRMCKACGYQVRSLKRIRVMNVSLDGLFPGQYRELTGKERDELYARAGLSGKA